MTIQTPLISRWTWTLLAFFALFSQAGAQTTLHDLTDEDVAAWSQTYGTPLLSPDGKWFVYIWSGYERVDGHARRGPLQLIVRHTDSDEERRYPLGVFSGGYPKVSMSPSGKWIAYTKPGSIPGRTAGAVMELDSDKSWELGNVQDVQFSEDERWIAVNEGADGVAAGSYILNVQALSGHREGLQPQHRWSGVREHALGASGQRIAFVDASGAYVQELGAKGEYLLPSQAGDGYRFLRWSPKGKSLALIRQHGGALQVVVLNSEKGQWRNRLFDPQSWEGFPKPYEIAGLPLSMSQQGPLLLEVLRWREEEDGIYFYIQQKPIEGPKQADLILWHWKDPWIPAARQQPGTGVPATPERHLSYLSLPEGRFVRLADEVLSNVIPQARGKYALGFSWKQYGTSNAMSAANFRVNWEKRDYALVDLTTGVKRELESMKGLEVLSHVYWRRGGGGAQPHHFGEPHLSPEGSAVLYQDKDSDYCVYEVATRRVHNITRDEPSWNRSRRENSRFDPSPIELSAAHQGWTEDGSAMFFSDGHDIWLLPTDGRHAKNLTLNANREGIVYTILASPKSKDSSSRSLSDGRELDPLQKKINLSEKIYFTAKDANTFRSSLMVLRPGASALDTLDNQDASVTYYKAADANNFIRLLSDADEGANYFYRDAQRKEWNRLTDLTPERRQFSWPKARLLRFKSSDGKDRKAALFLPSGTTKEHPVPAIAHVYMDLSVDRLHELNNPGDIALFRWLRKGYAVICPDIRTSREDVGPGALSAILGAVNASIATGLVDRERLGIHGHSQGAYETYYTISRSNIFKAAVALAGHSDLQSAYGLTDNNIPGSMWIEDLFLPNKPWWEDRKALARNSPIEKITDIHTPLLIGHGDADSVVGFSQGVEMFTSLRRLENRPVVLLQYAGEEHGVDSNPDLMKREQEFFAHFLKSKPAPAWWSDGVSYYQGQAPVVSDEGDK